jgi:hypothetical protein
MRGRRALHFFILSPPRQPLYSHDGRPMKSMFLPAGGFTNRANRMLRPRIVEALDALGQLNALELAGLVYGPRRRALRRGRPAACTTAQLVATRRALRRLAAKGRVVSTGRYRRWKLYALKRSRDALASISLGPFP